MERVGILINKLQEQLATQADIKNMLVTAQMLQAELLQKARQTNGQNVGNISVVMPHHINFGNPDAINMQTDVPKIIVHIPEEPKILIPLEIPENEVENHLPVEILTPDYSGHKIPSGWLFDPNEVPTLAHQEKIVYELNDTILSEVGSLNESLNEQKTEVSSILQDVPIRDLKKAISINDRHQFIHDLFRDDETMYERSIKTINSFNIYAEAEFWILRELKLKLGWDNNNFTVKAFDQLVKRRFS